MLRLRTITRGPAAAIAVAGGTGACLYGYAHYKARGQTALCEAPTVAPAPVKDVAKRLGAYVKIMEHNEDIHLRAVAENVKIYGVVDEKGHQAAGGLPVVRAAQTIIKAPIDEVSLCWWQAGKRKRWDSINTQDCQMVQSLDNKSRLIYLQGKAKKGGLVSSRDFCYTMYNAPPDLVGAKAGSALYVQVNNAEGVPPNKASTRGDVNSLLLLEPVDALTTKASYAIEMDVKGWLPVKVVKGAADETPLTLAAMRDYLEGMIREESTLGPEAAAKHALSRRTSRLSLTPAQALTGAWNSKEDLLASKQLLEKQLKKLDIDERKTGLDLTDLRNKLKKDIADINKRLKG